MARIKNTKPSLEASPRHFWLAGLGVAVIAGRLAARTATQTVNRAQQLRGNAISMAGTAQARAFDVAGDLRERVQTGIAQLNDTAEKTLSPLIARLRPAKAKRTVRRGRKPVAKTARRVGTKKKTSVRRTRKA